MTAVFVGEGTNPPVYMDGVMEMGDVNGAGSVVSMVVPLARWTVQRDATTLGGLNVAMDVIAFGVVVVGRSGWVVSSRVEPLVMCCGGVVGLETHMAERHPGETWSMRCRL